MEMVISAPYVESHHQCADFSGFSCALLYWHQSSIPRGLFGSSVLVTDDHPAHQ